MPKSRSALLSIFFAAVGLAAGAQSAFSQIVPADRSTLWNPGIPGGIPTRTTICETVTAPSGDAFSAIQGAIDACPAGQVVQLAAGTYTLGGGPLQLNKGITLRGVGVTTLLKKPAGTGSAVVAIGSPFPSYKSSTNLTSNAVKEASSVTVASTSGLSVGQIVLIDKTNETGVSYNAPDCDSNCQGWFARSGRQLSQMMEISAISGNTVTFSTPFHVTFDTGHGAQLTTFNSAAVKNAGLEDLKVYGGEGGDSGGNIYMEMAAYSWVARVESAWSRGGSIHVYYGFRNVVRDSYFHESPNNDPGGEGYGITIDKSSADNLIENNISWAFNKVMLMRSAGGGNVIGYNYFEDGYGNSYKNYVETGANATHMTTSHFELFEGNQAFNIGAETRWGNADHITFFRNHATGLRRSLGGLGLSDGNRLFAAVKARNYYYTFVGNVIGSPGMTNGGGFTYEYNSGSYPDNPAAMWRLGEPDSGGTPGISGSGDPQVAATILRQGNFDYATNTVKWDTSAQTIPNSLYLTSKPAFFGNNPWPWVDPTGATKLFTLPARFRFDNPGASQSSTLGITDVSVTEGNSGTTLANFVVSLAPAATGTVTVNYATADGTATAGSDYVAQSGTLTFTAGQTSKTIAVVVNGDTLAEPNETFVVNLSGASGATIADGQGIGTILNDDVLPTLSVNDVSLTEGNSGTKSAVFTVSLSAASTAPVTATYTTANGTATAGSDYVAAAGTVTFPAGTTTQTINVTVNGDTTVEPNETFFLNLSAAVGATIADAQGIGTILNDDTTLPTLSVAGVSVNEGNSGTTPANFVVTLSPAATGTVTVTYSTANGTATAGSDYVAQSGTLTFTAGQTSKTIAVVVNGDTTIEPNETFTVTLSSPTGATIQTGVATGTILNDDSAPLPTLSIADVSVTEGNSGTVSANFVVSLSTAATSTVTVGYTTANGTATAGSDYVAQSGTLTFTAGQTSKTVSVLVNGDTTVEPNETFTVTLSGPSGATLSRAQATGTILNDDVAALPALSISNATVTEGNTGTTTATFTVSLSAASSSAITVNYATADITATAGSDYVAKTGSLTFSAGQTSNMIAVTVNGDTTVEPDETFSVNLTSPVGATIANAQGIGTITNDDAAAGGAQPVVWTSMVGVSASGNSLTKMSATGTDAGATSTQQIASGDGYVEFKASEAVTYRMLGLSKGNTNSSYADIDFAIELASGGVVFVFENGTGRGQFGTYTTGDTFRVAVVGGVVKYSKNGVVFYTSTLAPTYPLIVDSWLYTLSATLNSVVISGGGSSTPPPGTQPVVWTSLVGVSAPANSLVKTTATGVDSGAVSTKQIAAGDGYVEFTASESSSYRMLGLSNGNTGVSYPDIDFGVELASGGGVFIFEKGVGRGQFGNYVAGDLFRVAMVGGVVKYSKNGTLFYTSGQTATYPLLVDTWLYTQNSTLSNVVLSGAWQ